jgi:FAD/FMN-containing dehydrogenase
MKGIRVDPVGRSAIAQPGLIWADFDHETQAFGLATPGGEISDTGIAGLTLGGGIGWLSRPFGLACDNLVSADVVTADGDQVVASAEQNTDLFWGLRGGGGNFGIVTSFQYNLHPVGPMLLAGGVMYPASDAPAVLRFYRDWAAEQPEHVSTMVALITAPPAPFVPPELRGQRVISVGACHVGPIEEGQRRLQPLRTFGSPAADLIDVMPYTALQSMFDESTPPGNHNYVKSEWLNGLTDDVIDAVLDQFEQVTSPFSQILLRHLGGAVRRVPSSDTAFVYRDTEYVLTVPAIWQSPTEDAEPHKAWARAVWEATQPVSCGGGYVNHLDVDEGDDRLRHAYGPETFDRLVALKTEWDPTNFFRLNQNIRPRLA